MTFAAVRRPSLKFNQVNLTFSFLFCLALKRLCYAELLRFNYSRDIRTFKKYFVACKVAKCIRYTMVLIT